MWVFPAGLLIYIYCLDTLMLVKYDVYWLEKPAVFSILTCERRSAATDNTNSTPRCCVLFCGPPPRERLPSTSCVNQVSSWSAVMLSASVQVRLVQLHHRNMPPPSSLLLLISSVLSHGVQGPAVPPQAERTDVGSCGMKRPRRAAFCKFDSK